MEVALDSLPSYVPPASASIRNLSLTSSSLRVHLRPLLADIPFVGAVTISFLQSPEIDFDLVKKSLNNQNEVINLFLFYLFEQTQKCHYWWTL